MKRLVLIASGVFALGLSLGLGYWLGQRTDSAPAAGDTVAPDERKVLYWYDPMVPDQHFDQAGKSPFMDMMLVPRYADEAGAAAVQVDPGLQQSLGVRTERVELTTVPIEVRAPGTLQWDLRNEQRVTARVEGLVERVHVRTPFTRVRRGEPLATLLAPALSSALAEYRALASGESAGARELQTAARSRLHVLGLNAADLRTTNDGVPRIVLRAPVDGVLAEVVVREGETVMAGQPLFRVNGTDAIWLEARVAQADAGSLQPGATAQIEVSAFPETPFDGLVETVLPQVDPATRTQGVRIVLPNPDGQLAAGMFADAVLRASDPRRCPWVPSEALILTGRDARVIVKDADGGFRPVPVRTGRQVGERTEILDGLAGGEEVVVSGQFLIDSEASLSGLLSRLSASEADDATSRPTPEMDAHDDPVSATSTEREVLYWYDPMVPDKHFDQPGKSPYMDMQLVPKYADEVESDDDDTGARR